MAYQHQLNGSNINYISQANWQQPVVDQSLNLIAVHSRHWRLIWTANVMPVATWDVLNAARGTAVSVMGPPHDNQNSDYITYYDARLDAVDGQHEGLNVVGVRAEFLVKV